MDVRLDGCRVWMGMTAMGHTAVCHSHAKDQMLWCMALLWGTVLLRGTALSEVQREPAVQKIKM